jgi:CP family cyanate transporter-like MFS transporter
VLPEIRADLGLGGVLAGVLTTLPPLCFAVIGLLAPIIVSRVGLHRAAFLSLVAIAIGQAVRVIVPEPAVFFVATVLALIGMATGNVLLPPLVRRDFPDRIGPRDGDLLSLAWYWSRAGQLAFGPSRHCHRQLAVVARSLDLHCRDRGGPLDTSHRRGASCAI